MLRHKRQMLSRLQINSGVVHKVKALNTCKITHTFISKWKTSCLMCSPQTAAVNCNVSSTLTKIMVMMFSLSIK